MDFEAAMKLPGKTDLMDQQRELPWLPISALTQDESQGVEGGVLPWGWRGPCLEWRECLSKVLQESYESVCEKQRVGHSRRECELMHGA